MASVKHLGGNKYKVTISAGQNGSGDRKRIYKTITAKSEASAKKQANLLEAEIDQGNYQEPTKYSFAEYVTVWKKDAERKLAPKTFHRYNELLSLHILKGIGNVKLEKLNPILIEQFYNDLREPVTYVRELKDGTKKTTTRTLSEATIKHCHRLISAILAGAYKKGLLKENPCARVDAPAPKKQELIIYNEDQIAALLEALEDTDNKFKTCIHLALASGLRLGELMGLEWQDVDFNHGNITVSRSSQYLPGQGTFTKEPKNESSKRLVSLPAPVMALLGQLKTEQDQQAEKLGNKWEGSNRLFTTATGSPMHPYTPTKQFKAFLEEKKLPPLVFHGLRHTSASYLISCGQDVVTVSKRLGHSNTSTTLNVYSHSFRKRDEEAANRMEGLYTKKEEPQPAEEKPKLRRIK